MFQLSGAEFERWQDHKYFFPLELSTLLVSFPVLE